MLLTVSKSSKTSVFDQIFNQITNLINSGTLAAGSKLPPTRELAKTLGVNRSTIVRVYEELWAQGYIESNPGSYTRVRKRQTLNQMESESGWDSTSLPDFYKDHLGLPYDPIMYYIENGKSIEKGKINFLQLAPDTRLLDEKKVRTCMRDALNKSGSDPFDFTHARGYPPLRQEIARYMKLHNIHAGDKNILVTNGSLQSLQLIFQTFSKPGDYIVIEKPTYSIVLHLITLFKLKPIEIPVTEEGMDLKVLRKALDEKSVRFVYTLPTYQNPTGMSMSQNKREEMLEMCGNKDCIILEDSLEEEMKYSGKAYLPIKSIDRKGQVIYLGAFTKVLAPGLRMGWVVATPECIKKLTVLKSILEVSSGSLNQVFLYNFFRTGAYEMHLRKAIRVFKKRMKVAIQGVKKYVPADKIEWIEPNGGYMIWLKLLTKPLENIENHLSNYGVVVHNGKYFFAGKQTHDYIRICIAQVNEAEIEEGMKRLGEAIRALE